MSRVFSRREEIDTGHELQSNEQQDPTMEQSESMAFESRTQKSCVLLGSAILQLPIWG
jgi:hypothetical protein